MPWAVVSTPVAEATARPPSPDSRSAMAGTRAMNGEAMRATTAMVTTADQQDGSVRATVKPWRSEASRLPWPRPAGGASRTNASAATTARNDTALASKASG